MSEASSLLKLILLNWEDEKCIAKEYIVIACSYQVAVFVISNAVMCHFALITSTALAPCNWSRFI